MNSKRFRIAIVLIVCVIIAGFLSLVVRTRDAAPMPVALKATSTPVLPVVAFHDSFKKGTHTLSGSIVVANACIVPSVQASLLGDASSTQSILVDVTVPDDSGLCLQVSEPAAFSTTLSASANLPITVRVNGTVASTTPL